MIDWVNLGANALWILGCSVCLASISFASWIASEKKQKISLALRSKGVWMGLHAGGILFCAGLAATSDSILLAVLWVIVGVGMVAHYFIG